MPRLSDDEEEEIAPRKVDTGSRSDEQDRKGQKKESKGDTTVTRDLRESREEKPKKHTYAGELDKHTQDDSFESEPSAKVSSHFSYFLAHLNN